MTRIPDPLPLDASPPSEGLPAPSSAISPTWIFTETETAKLLRLSRRTLQRLRLEGAGPRFVRLTPSGSRIGYAYGDLQAWIRERSAASTSAATVANDRAAKAAAGVA